MPIGRPVGQSDVLEPAEIRKILSLPDRRSKDGIRDYAILLVLANTPMRKGELICLNVNSLIDEGQKFVSYKGLKKKSGRPYWLKIPISDEVHRGLRRYLESDNPAGVPADRPLFLTLGKHGPYEKSRITAKAVDCLVGKYVGLAKIAKRVTPHSFRATYLTLRAAKDPWTLTSLSGHSDVKLLNPYVRRTEQRKREAALLFSFT
jgi:integrase/recombinase XerD